MKKKILILAAGLALIFFLAYRFSPKKTVEVESQLKAPLEVTVQDAADSSQLKEILEYPAAVVGDREITVTAKASGNAVSVPFNIGDRISAGALLVRIDDIGNTLSAGFRDFQSREVQQASLSKDQAREVLDAAKENRNSLKKIYDRQRKNSDAAQTVTKAQVDSAESQVDVAEIQLKNAEAGLKGTLDNHLIVSPISGFVTGKSVSVGDSIASGQTLATISQTNSVKLQFFVDQEHLADFFKGLKINITGNNGESIPAVVRNISPSADPVTKRFLIEVFPEKQSQPILSSGTLATVSLEVIRRPKADGNLLLPLSAITVGQNENHIFINENGKAKEANVAVVAVRGESAEVKADVPSDAQIIINGSKLVKDGDLINVRK